MKWARHRLKHLASVRVSNVDKKTVDGQIPVRLINYTDVYYGDRLSPDMALMSASATQKQISDFRLFPGDVVITKDSETADDIGVAAYVDRSADDMVCGYHLGVLRPRRGIVDGRYLFWSVVSDHARSQFSAGATGVTRYGLRIDVIASTEVLVPSLGEQRVIADFLDDETDWIDAVIAKKRRLINLLDERFAQLISREQSRWDLVPLKRAVLYQEGPGIMAADFREDGVPLIRVAGVGSEEITLDACNYLDSEMVQSRWSHFRLMRGDYLISASASMGVVSRVGKAAEGAVPYTGLILFRPQRDTHMEYVRFFLRSQYFLHQIEQLKTGTAIQHFGPSHLGQVRIPLAPPEEQERIGTLLLNQRRATDRAIDALTRQIELLTERRQALITAAVTGELDVARHLAKAAS